MKKKVNVGEYLKGIVDLPEEVMPSGKYLILPVGRKNDWRRIFTDERLRIISVLKNANPISETELAEMLGRKRENVIYDLNILKHFGLVRIEKEDNRAIARINKDVIIIPC